MHIYRGITGRGRDNKREYRVCHWFVILFYPYIIAICAFANHGRQTMGFVVYLSKFVVKNFVGPADNKN